MLKSVQNFLEKIIDAIIPQRKDYVTVAHITNQGIMKLPKADPVEGHSWITSLFQYKNDTVRAIIWELKYKGVTLPLDNIGKLMFDEILASISDTILFEAQAKFLLIPVPISNESRAERGYNQSEYIARSIVSHDSERLLLYAPQWFEKIRETPKQSKTESREDRLRNLHGCFRADPRIANHYVILVDDVVTTGSTLSEARKTLLEAGSRDVFAFTIAH